MATLKKKRFYLKPETYYWYRHRPKERWTICYVTQNYETDEFWLHRIGYHPLNTKHIGQTLKGYVVTPHWEFKEAKPPTEKKDGTQSKIEKVFIALIMVLGLVLFAIRFVELSK